MVKRVCPHCGESWFSSDTTSRDWICAKCGEPIPKSEERNTEDK